MTFWSKGSQGGISEGIGSNFSRNLSVVELGLVSFSLVVTACRQEEAQKFVGFLPALCCLFSFGQKTIQNLCASATRRSENHIRSLTYIWFCNQHRTTLIFSVAFSLWFSSVVFLAELFRAKRRNLLVFHQHCVES